MSQFFNHKKEDGTTCLATIIDGEKVLIDKKCQADFYKSIKESIKSKNLTEK